MAPAAANTLRGRPGASAADAIALDDSDDEIVLPFGPAAAASALPSVAHAAHTAPIAGPSSAHFAPVAGPSMPIPSASAAPAQQRLLVLCGVVGAGKSTLACALEEQLGYVRVCQDVLGDRRACEDAVELHLGLGSTVVVDRTNFDYSQRQHWINIAQRHPGVETCAVVLTTSYRDCSERLLVRTGHETLHDPDKALAVLANFTKMFREPSSDEGFDRIVRLPPDLPRRFDRAGSLAIVERIARSPRQMRIAGHFGAQRARGGSPRGSPSRGRGRGRASPYARR